MRFLKSILLRYYVWKYDRTESKSVKWCLLEQAYHEQEVKELDENNLITLIKVRRTCEWYDEELEKIGKRIMKLYGKDEILRQILKQREAEEDDD